MKSARIILAYARINTQGFVAYRTQTYINAIIGTTVWVFFTVYSVVLLTNRTGGIYEWSRAELVLMAGMYNVFIGLFSMTFGASLSVFAHLVGEGKLDGFLLKPIDAQFHVSIWQFRLPSLLRTIAGIIVCIYIASVYRIPISTANIVMCCILMIIACIILYAITLVINTLNFWANSLDNISELFYTLRGLGRYPYSMYRAGNELVAVLLSPFILILNIPMRALVGKVSIEEIVTLIVLCVGVLGTSRLLWRFALRRYTSASS